MWGHNRHLTARTLCSLLMALPSHLAPPSAAPAAAGTGFSSAAAMSASVADQKRALRAQIKRAIRAMPSAQRAEEDLAIQNHVLNSSWFKSSKRLCAYISCDALREVETSRIIANILQCSVDGDHTQAKELYVPHVEDKNRNMRMFKITSMADMVPNSMNILEPSPQTADGIQREDVLDSTHPVDLFLLPGVCFDKNGRRLGRGGGYYDTFLKKYQDLALENKWNQPLLVALAYSVQIMDENVIPVTPTDIPIDAIVTSSGVLPIAPSAVARMQ